MDQSPFPVNVLCTPTCTHAFAEFQHQFITPMVIVRERQNCCRIPRFASCVGHPLLRDVWVEHKGAFF